MGTFVNHDEKGVVGKRADTVRHGKHDPPRSIADEESQPDLRGDDGHRNPERHRVDADEISNLGMILQ